MEVTIARNMTVADAGVAKQFLKGRTYDVDAHVKRRLQRAGALADPKTAKEEPAEDKGPDLNRMNKAQLIEHAATLGLTLGEELTKAQLIEAINAKPAE